MLLGGTAAAQPSPQAPAPAASALAAAPDKQTILGMPATGLPAPPEPAPPAPAFAPAMKTMLGVAMPGIAPMHAPTPAPAPARVQPSVPAQTMSTLLGVAAPGVAPTQPDKPARDRGPSTPRMPTAPLPAAPILPPPPPLVVEPLPAPPSSRAVKSGVPAIALVAIVFVVVAVIGVGAALLVLRQGAALAAQPQLDENGKESLKIRCDSCPDGTTITLGASFAKVAANACVLPLPAPLSVGDNDLDMKIERPAPGRTETVKVHVPVAYRVKADLSTLTAVPPTVTVRVEAGPGAEVTVDGKPVSLDATGKASPTIDVTKDVEGPSDEAKTIDLKIPFSVKAKGAAAAESGQLAVRAGVAPLHLDAPGRDLFTTAPSVAIVGQAKPGATLSVDGQGAAVDAQGHFGVRMDIALGERTLAIVTAAPPLAPRTVHAKVTRVTRLDDAAKTLDGRGPLAFDAFRADPTGSVGKLVVVDGEVVEARGGKGHTVFLVDEKKACSGATSCLVRIVQGEEIAAARGDAIRAYGTLVGTVTSGDRSVPDVEGSLVVTTPRGGKKK
jgi:hypothetical protein